MTRHHTIIDGPWSWIERLRRWFWRRETARDLREHLSARTAT